MTHVRHAFHRFSTRFAGVFHSLTFPRERQLGPERVISRDGDQLRDRITSGVMTSHGLAPPCR